MMTNQDNTFKKNQGANPIAKSEWLYSDLIWLSAVISTRTNKNSIPEAMMVEEVDEKSNYAELVKKHNMDTYDRLLLILTIAPYVLPSLFKDLFPENQTPKPFPFQVKIKYICLCTHLFFIYFFV